MLGRNKWKFFTFITFIGVTIGAHTEVALAQTKALINPEVPSFTNDKLGITIESLNSVNQLQQQLSSRRRQLRNLVPPYQEFSSRDEVQFIDSRTRNSRNLPGTFGSFRYNGNNLSLKTSSPSPFRRSDEYDDTIGTYPASQIAYDLNYDFDDDYGENVTLPTTTTLPPLAVTDSYNRFRHKIIPISFKQENIVLKDLTDNESNTEGHERHNATSSTVKFEDEYDNADNNNTENDSDERKGKKIDNNDDENSDKIRFPDESKEQQPQSEALTARRSGIYFSENEGEINRHRRPQPQLFNPFVPLSYSEESLNFGDAISNLQRPYHSDEIDRGSTSSGIENENDRSANGNRYYLPFMAPAPFRDDHVTKFGDTNGPVTAFNRQVRDYTDQVVFYPRTQYESTASGSSQFYGEQDSQQRPSRAHFFPPKVYTEYPDYPLPQQQQQSGQINSKYYQQPAAAVATTAQTYNWKTRQPRVIFPAPDFGPGTTYVGNDNVVFRDQNFGINDLVAIKDVRNEFENDDSTPVAKDKGCGISLAKQVAQRRIVGGDDAGFGNFPWQAYIRIGSSRCGGSLVSRRHVVTAGHCVARAIPRQVHVTLGDYVINSAVEPLPAYTFGVRQINVHPYFKFTPQADRFDVAVLTLERPVHYMPHIAPICLPDKNEEFLGKYGWAAGWGALSPGSRLRPKTLQAVDVPVIDNRVCERWHRSNGINVVIYPEMLCAGHRNGRKDSCQGDSGGPLMHEKSGRWYLIGIVSAGYSCASKGQPGIYHRVPHTVDWISHIIKSAT
ncbi:unnamed protein product [Chironomus riparius]|uniref:Peptidase S1 domain-containing protein n=1 Tax=Chironomus riparius TaxID=315576 RepID=A0A9P0NDX8_9DIPT|nr:unnamed protein product [Chironomus riparius]